MNVRPLAFALLFTVAAPLSAAPTPEQRKVARVHYEKAVNHFNLGEYNDAAEEFRQVYKASPQPVILYDAAQAYRLANQGEQALTLYESFLRESPNAPVRGEVERRIAELRGKRDNKGHVEASDPKNDPTASKSDPVKTDPKAEPKTKPEAKTQTKVETTTVAVTAPARGPGAPDGTGGSERLKPVADLIKAHRDGFRACFDKWSNAHPGIEGKVKLSFYLDPDGQLDQAQADTSGFDSPDVAGCIEDFAGTLKYPKSTGGKFTRFSYPFDFKPSSR